MNVPRHLAVAAISLSAALFMAQASPVSTAASPSCACDNGPITHASAHYPDWTGVWVRVGGLSDPRVKRDYTEVPPSPTDETDWPPLTQAYREKYRVITKALDNGERLNDPTANCLPAGFPWMMNMPYPMEIHQTAAQLTIIAEWMSQTRRIYIGAHHPRDVDPTFFGDSIAHWQGNTLVVDTIGLRSDTTMNDSGLMHGKNTHVIERWSQSKDGILNDELTVLDDDMLTQPWVRTFHYRREPTMRVMEYVCENNRDYAPRAPITP
jgi:hypothetical protein